MGRFAKTPSISAAHATIEFGTTTQPTRCVCTGLRLSSICCEPILVGKTTMKNSRLVATAAIAVLAGSVFQPALAQYPGDNGQYPGAYNGQQQYPGDNGQYPRAYNGQQQYPGAYNGQQQYQQHPGAYDGQQGTYQNGYRAGYDDARANRRFDDRIATNNRYDDERSQLWQRRYTRVSTYNDDNYYRECRTTADPAGVIAGALIGGLLGNAVVRGNARPGATIAGVIVGGALGAGLTRNLNCEDRSYTYRAYYEGFNAGRPNQQYEWRNPRNGRRGIVRVGQYYNDPDGFRCTTFSQAIYIGRTAQEAQGRACQQPDGTWTIVG